MNPFRHDGRVEGCGQQAIDGIVFIDRLTTADRKLAMKEIRESEWFGSATANGASPIIKVSPHFTNGLGN